MKKFVLIFGVCAVILAVGGCTSGTKAQAKVPTDISALDRAGGASLIERMESLNGSHILDYAAETGSGSLPYELVEL